jgi:hypothetical protein
MVEWLEKSVSQSCRLSRVVVAGVKHDSLVEENNEVSASQKPNMRALMI